MPRFLPRLTGVGVIELHGILGATIRSSVYYQILDRVERSSAIGCVILDIDSSGGSAAASEDLYMKVSRLAKKKPVVAFIRGTGASGAYLVACGASRIVAMPSAIVGSLGVISMRPVVADLLERLGISVSVSKSGPLKDMGAFYRQPTPEEESKAQSLVSEIYQSLLERVAEARHMSIEQLQPYATGEVYTARRGKEIGLVDELGDFDAALDISMSLGQVPRRVVYLRPPRSMRMRLMGRLASWALEGVIQETGVVTADSLWYL